MTSQIRPPGDDRWAGAWPEMDRFERVCWYWMAENRYLRRATGETVQFETLLVDYDYFASRLLRPLGLTLSEDAWRAVRQRPKNVTKQYRIPHWSSWDEGRKRAFEEICGEEMRENGYDVEWSRP